LEAEHKRQKRKRLRQILVVLFCSTVLSVLAAEVLYRALRPNYFPPQILRADGSSVPMSEMVALLRLSGEGEDSSQPRARIQGHIELRYRYDRPRWDYFDDEGCITVRTNSLGFRDLEFPVHKPARERRILAIGDSFTFGSGVPLEDCWVQVLEGLLETEWGRPVEVINGGFASGSFWPPGYVDWLASDGLAFEPDMVVLGFCLNDVDPLIPMLSYPGSAPEPWLGGISMLLNDLQKAIEDRRLQQMRDAAGMDFAEVVKHHPGPWEECRTACLAMRGLLAERDIPFVVVVFPMLSELGDAYPYKQLHAMVDAFFKDHGIDYLDLLPRFRGLDETELWVHPTDQHPNDVASRMVAEGIFEYLRAR
jgi:hypothetical protein